MFDDPINPPKPQKLSVWDATAKAEQDFGIPDGLLRSLGQEESYGLNQYDENGNQIKSPTGATGAFQFTKGTARQYNVNRNDPLENIIGAAAYMKDNYNALKPLIHDDTERWTAAAVAHNRGLGAVQGMIKDGRFEPSGQDSGNGGDTRTYATKILNNWAKLRGGKPFDPTEVSTPDNPTLQPAQIGTPIPDQFVDAQDIANGVQAPVTAPEAPKTLNAQRMSALSPQSPRMATLYTAGEPIPPITAAETDLPLADGRILRTNTAKLQSFLQGNNATPADIISGKVPVASLIGKVADVQDTTQGPTVLTKAPDGTEVSASVTPTPQAAAAQVAVDQASFPGSKSQIVDAQDVVAQRQIKVITDGLGRSYMEVDDQTGLQPNEARLMPVGRENKSGKYIIAKKVLNPDGTASYEMPGEQASAQPDVQSQYQDYLAANKGTPGLVSYDEFAAAQQNPHIVPTAQINAPAQQRPTARTAAVNATVKPLNAVPAVRAPVDWTSATPQTIDPATVDRLKQQYGLTDEQATGLAQRQIANQPLSDDQLLNTSIPYNVPDLTNYKGDKTAFAIQSVRHALEAELNITPEAAAKIVGDTLEEGPLPADAKLVRLHVSRANIAKVIGADRVKADYNAERAGPTQEAYQQTQEANQAQAATNPNFANVPKSDYYQPSGDPLLDEARRIVAADPASAGDEAAVQAEYERLKRVSLTPEQAAEATQSGTNLAGEGLAGSAKSGLIGAAGRTLTSLAGVLRIAINPLGVIGTTANIANIPNEWLDSLTKTGKQLSSASATEAQANPGLLNTALRVGTGLFGDVPRYLLLYRAGFGRVLFGTDALLQSTGAGDRPAETIKAVGKGLAMDAIFHGAGKVAAGVQNFVLRATKNPVFDRAPVAATVSDEKMAELVGRLKIPAETQMRLETDPAFRAKFMSDMANEAHEEWQKQILLNPEVIANTPAERLAAKLFGEGARVGTIGTGVFFTEGATGKPKGEAFESAITMAITGLVMANGGDIAASIKDLAGKVFKFTGDGKTANVTVTPEGEIKLLKTEVPDGLVDVDMVLDPTDSTYKQPSEVGKPQPETAPATETYAGEPAPTTAKALSEVNPQRIETPDPAAVQKAQIDSRTRKVADALQGKDFTTVDELAKATRMNKTNVEDALMTLYGARMVEFLPGKRARLINAADTAKQTDLYERAKNYGQTPETPPSTLTDEQIRQIEVAMGAEPQQGDFGVPGEITEGGKHTRLSPATGEPVAEPQPQPELAALEYKGREVTHPVSRERLTFTGELNQNGNLVAMNNYGRERTVAKRDADKWLAEQGNAPPKVETKPAETATPEINPETQPERQPANRGIRSIPAGTEPEKKKRVDINVGDTVLSPSGERLRVIKIFPKSEAGLPAVEAVELDAKPDEKGNYKSSYLIHGIQMKGGRLQANVHLAYPYDLTPETPYSTLRANATNAIVSYHNSEVNDPQHAEHRPVFGSQEAIARKLQTEVEMVDREIAGGIAAGRTAQDILDRIFRKPSIDVLTFLHINAKDTLRQLIQDRIDGNTTTTAGEIVAPAIDNILNTAQQKEPSKPPTTVTAPTQQPEPPKVPKGMRSLSQFVRAFGGIRGTKYDIGEHRRISNKETGSTGLINKNSEYTAEQMGRTAWEHGYLRDEFETIADVNGNDFMGHVEDDVTGVKKHYAQDDMNRIADEYAKWQNEYAGENLTPEAEAEYAKRQDELLTKQVAFLNDADAQNILAKVAKEAQYDKEGNVTIPDKQLEKQYHNALLKFDIEPYVHADAVLEAYKEAQSQPYAEPVEHPNVVEPQADNVGEARAQEIVPATAQKEPWQQTRAEYFDERGFHRLSNGELTLQTTNESGKTRTQHLGRTRTRFWLKENSKRHLEAVEQALKEGKPVPPEVLAEYPNLKPKETPKTERAPANHGIRSVKPSTEELSPAMQAKVQYARERGQTESDIAQTHNLTAEQVASVPPLPPVGQGGQMSYKIIQIFTPSKTSTDAERADKIAMVNDLASELGLAGERLTRDAKSGDIVNILNAARLAVANEMLGEGKRGSHLSPADWLKWLDTHADKLEQPTVEGLLEALGHQIEHSEKKVAPFRNDKRLQDLLTKIDTTYDLEKIPSLRQVPNKDLRDKIYQLGYEYGLKQTATERTYEAARETFLRLLGEGPEQRLSRRGSAENPPESPPQPSGERSGNETELGVPEDILFARAAGNNPYNLPLAKIGQFETGKPVTFDFIRNTEKAPKDVHDTFAQSVEPAGRYMIERSPVVKDVPKGWEGGTITFDQPLVIEHGKGLYADPDNWKRVLATRFKARGKALSRKLLKLGYDGIVTVRDGDTSEIVDLSPIGTPAKKATPPPSPDDAINALEDAGFLFSKPTPPLENQDYIGHIIDNKGNIDYEQAKDVAGRIESGGLEIKRLDPEGERGRLAGGPTNVEASLILAANERASEAAGSRTPPFQRQEHVLEEYAKHEGVWFNAKDFVKEQQGFISKGVEAYVHRSPDGNSVYKLIDYKIVDRHATPLDFIDTRISLFNHLFPETAYELAGFTRGGDGNFRFVVKQPFIRDVVYTSPVERQTFMQNKGFTMTDKYGEAFANTLYHVSDLHEKNALKDKNGTIYVIDAVPKAKYVEPFDVVPSADFLFARAQAPVSPLGFYSAVEQAVMDRMPAKASAEQVRGILKPESGIKKDELDWLGIDQFLSDHPRVTKSEVLDFIRQNNVQLQEVVKDQEDLGKTSHLIDDDEARNRVTKFQSYSLPGAEPGSYRELLLTMPPLGKISFAEWAADYFGDISDLTPSQLELAHQQYAMALRDELPGSRASRLAQEGFTSSHFPEKNILVHVRFDTRDGGKTLHISELQSDWHQKARTLRGHEIDRLMREKGIGQEEAGKLVPKDFGYQDAKENQRILAELQKQKVEAQKEFDELHAKFQEARDKELAYRKVAAGSVLKKYGAKSYKDILTNEEAKKEYWAALVADPTSQELVAAANDVHSPMQDAAGRLSEIVGHMQMIEHPSPYVGEVPNAPFKSSWPEIAFKRILRYAAERGYSRVTWDTGSTQADRYDLSKQIESINVETTDVKGADVRFVTVTPKDGEKIYLELEDGKVRDSEEAPRIMVGKPLEDVVGKEMAQKILDVPVTDGWAKFTGDNLKTSAPGMVGFYDKMLPQFVNKYVKKFGSKVTESEIRTGTPKLRVEHDGDSYYVTDATGNQYGPIYRTETDAENWIDEYGDKGPNVHTVHSVDITPAMRESILAGQPLFARPTAFDQTDLFGNPVSPQTAQHTLFDVGTPTETTANKATTLESLTDKKTADFVASLAMSPDRPLASAAKGIIDNARFADKGTLEDAADALDAFSRARQTHSPLSVILRQPDFNGQTTADKLSPRAVTLAQAMESGDVGRVLKGSGMLFMTAGHVSPHVFEKFDISKIGTGEGNQAYGYGLYFYTRKEVEDHYDAMLRQPTLSINGERLNPRILPDWVISRLTYSDNYKVTAGGLISEFKRRLDEEKANLKTSIQPWNVETRIQAIGEVIDELRRIYAAKSVQPAKTGAKYQVDLKPAEDEYLLWDKPLSEQSEKVKKALEEGLKEYGGMNRFIGEAMQSHTGQQIYKELGQAAFREHELARGTSPDVVDYMSRGGASSYDAAASAYLHSLGIRGIKYLDGSSRHHDTDVIDKNGNIADLKGERTAQSFINGFKTLDEAIAEANRQSKDYPAMGKVADVLRTWKADGYSLREAKGSYNYVIFDDKDVEIQEVHFSKQAQTDEANATKFLTKYKGVAPENIATTAKAKTNADTKLLELNPQALWHVTNAIAEVAGLHPGKIWGGYIPPSQTRNVRQALVKQKNAFREANQTAAADGLSKIINAYDAATDATHNDVSFAISMARYPTFSKAVAQEELSHRADGRVNKVNSILGTPPPEMRRSPAYHAAETHLARQGYAPGLIYHEVTGKLNRDDAAEALGLTEPQVDELWNLRHNQLQEAGITPQEYRDAYSGIGETAAARIEQYGQRTREAEPGSPTATRGGPTDTSGEGESNYSLRSGLQPGGQRGNVGTQALPRTEDRPDLTRLRQAEILGASKGVNEALALAHNAFFPTGETSLAPQTPSDILFALPTLEELQDPEEETKTALQKMTSLIYDGKRDVGFYEAAMNLIRTGYLAGFSVIKTNLIGNTANIVAEQLSKPAMAVVDMANARFNPKAQGMRYVPGLSFPDIMAGIFGKNGLLREGIIGERGMLTGLVKGVGEIEASRVDENVTHAKNPNFVRTTGIPLIDIIVEGTKRLVVTIDRPFKAFARTAELHGLSRIAAKNAVAQGLDTSWRKAARQFRRDPSVLMHDLAERYAETLTFQNPNAVTDIYDKFRKIVLDEKELAKLFPTAAQHRLVKHLGGGLYLASGSFSPFVKTPTNIGIRAAEYLPTGIISAAWKFHRIGQGFERTHWMEETSLARAKMIANVAAARAIDDKEFRTETKKYLDGFKRRKEQRMEAWKQEIDAIENSKVFTDSFKKQKIADLKARKSDWMDKWEAKRNAYIAKRKEDFELIDNRRRVADMKTKDEWNAEDVFADVKFTAFENKQFAEAAGRFGFGTVVGGLLLLGVIKGILDAVGSTDYDDEKGKWYAKRAAGIPDASVRIGHYRFPYNNNPFGNAVNIGVNQIEQFDRPGSGYNRAGAMASRLGKDVRALNPLTTGEFTKDDFNSWAGSKANSITPVLNLKVLQELAEVMDNKPRKYWDEGFAAQYLIHIPKLRESLPISRNYIGGEAERGDITRRFLRMLDPLKTTREVSPQQALPKIPLDKKTN